MAALRSLHNQRHQTWHPNVQMMGVKCLFFTPRCIWVTIPTDPKNTRHKDMCIQLYIYIYTIYIYNYIYKYMYVSQIGLCNNVRVSSRICVCMCLSICPVCHIKRISCRTSKWNTYMGYTGQCWISENCRYGFYMVLYQKISAKSGVCQGHRGVFSPSNPWSGTCPTSSVT